MTPLFKVLMSEEAPESVRKTLLSGYIGEGPQVARFEERFAAAVGAEEVIATNSCTAAIDLALHLCGVGPADEVITTPVTCTATNSPIVMRGAVPVWADVDPISGLICPEDVKRKITRRTKAIIAVDWGGAPCDFASLRSFGLPVIEDAAHCLHSFHGGDFVCWSFQAIKHLTCGDGGALLTPRYYRNRARLLRWYGLDRRSGKDFRCSQNITEVGGKIHMNDIAAAIGNANLNLALKAVETNRANAAILQKALPVAIVPPWDNRSSWWIYTIRAKDRHRLVGKLEAEGIASSPVHGRNDNHTAFQRAAGRIYDLPGVEEFTDRNLAIPVGWWVTESELAQIAEVVCSVS